MSDHHQHITSYGLIGKILIILLLLTSITVSASFFELKQLAVAVALIIASVKGTLVLIYFMHLKFDHLLFKLLVPAVFLLFALFIVITFFDYAFQ